MTLNDKLLGAIFGPSTEVGYTDYLNAANLCRTLKGTHVVLLKSEQGQTTLCPVRLDDGKVFRHDGYSWYDAAVFPFPGRQEVEAVVGTADEVEKHGFAMLRDSCAGQEVENV